MPQFRVQKRNQSRSTSASASRGRSVSSRGWGSIAKSKADSVGEGLGSFRIGAIPQQLRNQGVKIPGAVPYAIGHRSPCLQASARLHCRQVKSCTQLSTNQELASDLAAKVSKPGRAAPDRFRNPETSGQPRNADSPPIFTMGQPLTRHTVTK